ALAGLLGASKVSLRLDAGDGRYSLVCSAGLPARLPPDCGIVRRSGMWSKLAMLARVDRPTGDAEFDGLFEVKGALRGRLSRRVTQGLARLARSGEVRVERGVILHRTASLDVEPAPMI